MIPILAPHWRANSMARGALTAESLSELTIWLGNGNGWSGIGAKLRKAGAQAGRSTSAGATSKAPRTWFSKLDGARSAQCATVMHPRLWAIRITGVLSAAIASARAAIQSSRRGVSQSSCSTRVLFGKLLFLILVLLRLLMYLLGIGI